MPIIKSCCCCRSLRKGCYAASIYTLTYFIITTTTMFHFIDVEQRYLSGEMLEPESESFLEPAKITPTKWIEDITEIPGQPGPDHVTNADGITRETPILTEKADDADEEDFRNSQLDLDEIKFIQSHLQVTVVLNISLLACSLLGIVGSLMLIFGIYKDMKFMLIPWIIAMFLETTVEITNLVYLGYLQTISFNPITSFLFTLDFFIISLNLYAVVCVISQFQEYLEGRGTAAFDFDDHLATVQYTATAQHTATTSSALSSRRRSAARPMPSRIDPEEFSEAPSMAPPTSVLARPSRSNIKKHVQFPDEQSCIVEDSEAPPPSVAEPEEEEKPRGGVISSLWMELETEVPTPDR